MATILNEEQLKAVTATEDACLVKACVGSGKTTVLIHRILYLHNERHIPFDKIAVITFTNKAADEIRDRIKKVLPDIKTENLKYFGTFHGLSLTLLREHEGLASLGYSKDFDILTPDEELDLALALAERDGLKISYKNRLKKRLEQYFSNPDKEKGKAQKDDFLTLAERLRQEKKTLGKMSFHDLIENFIVLERICPAFHYSKKCFFSQVLVDEVQDCDQSQLAFLDALLHLGYGQDERPVRASLFAVGDPNQVIYSFRGSCLNIFNTLQRKYQAASYSLVMNYRSSAAILTAAGKFQESGDKLCGVSAEETVLHIHESYDPFADATYLADRLRELHESGTPYGEMAILYRIQSQAELYQKVFEKNQIPCQIRKRSAVTDVPVLNWLIRYLKYVLNPDDLSNGIAFLTNKNYGPGLSGKKARKELGKKDPEKGIPEKGILVRLDWSSSEIIFRSLHLEEYLYPTRSTYKEDKELVLAFLEDIRVYVKGEIYKAGNDSKNPTGQNEINGQSEINGQNEISGQSEINGQSENAMTCQDVNLSSEQAADDKAANWVREYLNQLALHGQDASFYRKKYKNNTCYNIDSQTNQNDNGSDTNTIPNDAVSLMTLHASKGLEFDYCFIVGVNNGLIPINSKSETEIEEERRLFYVGITRARKGLEFTCYTEPGMAGVLPGPGMFLKRIPSDLADSNIKSGPATDFKTLRNLVQEEIRRKTADGLKTAEKDLSVMEEQTPQAEATASAPKTYTHPRYGTGTIIHEDDLMITVRFEGIGDKDFLKDFL